jgi:hypothetical protein
MRVARKAAFPRTSQALASLASQIFNFLKFHGFLAVFSDWQRLLTAD